MSRDHTNKHYQVEFQQTFLYVICTLIWDSIKEVVETQILDDNDTKIDIGQIVRHHHISAVIY